MRVGIVYPTPGSVGMVDVAFLQHLRGETKCEWLRVNLDWRNPLADALINRCHDAGCHVLPILDLDYAALRRPMSDADLADHLRPYLLFCIRVCSAYHFEAVEVLNEPHTMGKLSEETYARVVNAVGQELRTVAPRTQILVAAEVLKPDRRGPPPYDDKEWDWGKLRAGLVPHLWDAAAIHPYRNPAPPSRTRYGTRAGEYERIARAVGFNPAGQPRPLWVTEVGWDLRDGVDEATQAAYVAEELQIDADLGVEAVFLYAHVSPRGQGFGLFDGEDWRPRPAARVLQAWATGAVK